MADEFDESLLQRESWEPFKVTGLGEELCAARLPGGTELLVFEILGEKYALLTSQMTYYHVAQGSIRGAPFAIAFCCVCHSGAHLDPHIDGDMLNFECGGLYHGTAILRDRQTGSYWHHMTGEAMHGKMAFQRAALKALPLKVTTVTAALKDDPAMRLYRASSQTLTLRALNVASWLFQKTGYLPPIFIKTLPKEDARLPRMTLGLGVRVGNEARFYEMSHLKAGQVYDTVGNTDLTIALGDIDRVPFAVDSAGGRPMQYFLRWYGFALTCPRCSVWKP